MMKVLLEVKFYRGPMMRTVLSARCRADPSAFTGEDIDEVLENVVEHLRKHVVAFGGPKKERAE